MNILLTHQYVLHSKNHLLTVSFILLITAVDVVAADDISHPSPTTLETIKVTGEAEENKQKEHLEESFFETYSKDKILGKDLQNEGVTDVKAALKDIPNVSVASFIPQLTHHSKKHLKYSHDL